MLGLFGTTRLDGELRKGKHCDVQNTLELLILLKKKKMMRKIDSIPSEGCGWTRDVGAVRRALAV